MIYLGLIKAYKNGEIYIDCQGIYSNEKICLFPDKKYAGSKGVWFLPSKSVLMSWLRRTGFVDIDCFYAEPLLIEEQRTTSWAAVASLSDFLHKTDNKKTIEGYPRPWRFYVNAKKP